MVVYDLFMEPFERVGLRRLRKKLIPEARGKVLEIGAGTGANLKYYDEKRVSSLVMTDRELKRSPLEKKRNQAQRAFDISLKEEDVMKLAFPAGSFDTVVFTLVFCTVPDVKTGLEEIKRVLKKDGNIIFIEHIRPETKVMGKTFDRLTPAWKKVAKGCHLNRETKKMLEFNGFELKVEEKIMSNIFIGGTGNIK